MSDVTVSLQNNNFYVRIDDVDYRLTETTRAHVYSYIKDGRKRLLSFFM